MPQIKAGLSADEFYRAVEKRPDVLLLMAEIFCREPLLQSLQREVETKR
jgi:hypothetical protein